MISRAGERLLALVALAQRHQPGHLLLGQPDFLAAELGQREVLDLERLTAGLLGRVERVHFRTAVLIILSLRVSFSSRSGSSRISTPLLRRSRHEQRRSFRVR